MSKPRTIHTAETLEARCKKLANGCWEWQGYLQNGTPQVASYPGGKKKMVSVRKLFRELISGRPEPEGHYSNTCCNPICVNPSHTIWRGERSHMKHMIKHRKVTPTMIKKLRDYRIRTGKAKIDEQKAAEIRVSTETAPVLSARYGINKSLINKIKRGLAWRDLTAPFMGLFK